MKVLHVLYQSLPNVSGSSIRSRDIMMSQKEIGMDVIAVSAPFQPASSKKTQVESINGINYIRTSSIINENISDQQKPLLIRIIRFLLIFKFIFQLYKITKAEKPDVLHAHAMFFCGIPSIIVGRILKIPIVYEFRSLWMNSKSKNSKFNLFLSNLLLKIEIFTLNNSSCSIALNENLKEFLIRKGVKNKIEVIPNAVNTILIDQFKNLIKPANRKLLSFGYIGTITHYEGLPMLVKVFQELYDENIKNDLFIYGKGIDLLPLIAQIEKRNNLENIKYLGSIDPTNVYKAFNRIDVIINPRVRSEITETVTPLKPLEAMAYGKVVIGSDVGGIMELVSDGDTGFLFEADNPSDLKRVIKEVILINNNNKSKIIKNAEEYVNTQKSWNINAKKYFSIYKLLLNQSY